MKILKFTFPHGEFYYNMDQLIYATWCSRQESEPSETYPFPAGRKKIIGLCLVFVGQREDLKIEGANLERFISFMNANASGNSEHFVRAEDANKPIGRESPLGEIE